VGTWDVGPFDNDSAADWSGDLDDAPKAQRESIIRRTLSDAIDEPDYLDGDLGSEAIAAAAVVAALLPDSPPVSSGYGPGFLAAGDPLELPDDLVGLANQALDRVAAENSELRELWAEGDELRAWLATIAGIRAQLNGDA
jgi:hypothetical protein